MVASSKLGGVLADLSLFFCCKIQVLVDFNSLRLPGIIVPGLCGVAVVSGTREPRTHGSVPAEAILIFFILFYFILFFLFYIPDLLGRGLVF